MKMPLDSILFSPLLCQQEHSAWLTIHIYVTIIYTNTMDRRQAFRFVVLQYLKVRRLFSTCIRDPVVLYAAIQSRISVHSERLRILGPLVSFLPKIFLII
jgi:hypothetical protein